MAALTSSRVGQESSLGTCGGVEAPQFPKMFGPRLRIWCLSLRSIVQLDSLDGVVELVGLVFPVIHMGSSSGSSLDMILCLISVFLSSAMLRCDWVAVFHGGSEDSLE